MTNQPISGQRFSGIFFIYLCLDFPASSILNLRQNCSSSLTSTDFITNKFDQLWKNLGVSEEINQSFN